MSANGKRPVSSSTSSSTRTSDLPDTLGAGTDAERSELRTILLISPFEEDLSALQDIFRDSPWKVHGVRTCQEALVLLRENQSPVVICECDLLAGTWRDIWEALTLLDHHPELIVACGSRASDALWAEVLSRGAYDLLLKPFDAGEVLRIVRLAWEHWEQVKKRPPRQDAASAGG